MWASSTDSDWVYSLYSEKLWVWYKLFKTCWVFWIIVQIHMSVSWFGEECGVGFILFYAYEKVKKKHGIYVWVPDGILDHDTLLKRFHH